jgi:hypothetical protein
VKPNRPATIAMIAKMMAHLIMVCSLDEALARHGVSRSSHRGDRRANGPPPILVSVGG